MLWLWCRLAATAPIGPRAWEPPCAAGAALKKPKKKKDAVHIYNGLSLSYKKNEIMPFSATWMQLEILILSEVSERQIPYISLICRI